jgi:type IV secretory pathway component VirB8
VINVIDMNDKTNVHLEEKIIKLEKDVKRFYLYFILHSILIIIININLLNN